MFADDTVIATQHSNFNTPIKQLQDNVNIINGWVSKWCVQLNPTKSETRIFTLHRINNPTNIILNNKKLKWNSTDGAVTYLGIYLDKSLKWGYHINKKLKGSLHSLNSVISLNKQKI